MSTKKCDFQAEAILSDETGEFRVVGVLSEVSDEEVQDIFALRVGFGRYSSGGLG